MTKQELSQCLSKLYRKSLSLKEKGEIPVSACLLFDDGTFILEGNKVEETDNPLSHAEIMALEEGFREKNTRYLNNAVMIVSLEPCLMCLGAIIKAGIKELYYVLDDPKLGSLSHYHTHTDDRLMITRIDDDRFLPLFKDFFSSLRR